MGVSVEAEVFSGEVRRRGSKRREERREKSEDMVGVAGRLC